MQQQPDSTERNKQARTEIQNQTEDYIDEEDNR